jgi:hypothetical protein
VADDKPHLYRVSASCVVTATSAAAAEDWVRTALESEPGTEDVRTSSAVAVERVEPS